MTSLEDAGDALDKLDFKYLDLIPDQEHRPLAFLYKYPGKSKQKAIVLAAAGGHIVPKYGYCKSIDYLLVKQAAEEFYRIILYIDNKNNIYEFHPNRILEYIKKNRKNNLKIQDIESAVNDDICPVCGEKLSSHVYEGYCVKPSDDDAYECWHHRIKCYNVPLVKVLAQNINKGKCVQQSEAEKYFEKLFEEYDLPLQFTGCEYGIERLWGFKVDFVHIRHRDWGVEFHTNRDDNEARLKTAREQGCRLYIIDKPYQKYKTIEKMRVRLIENLCKFLREPRRRYLDTYSRLRNRSNQDRLDSAGV